MVVDEADERRRRRKEDFKSSLVAVGFCSCGAYVGYIHVDRVVIGYGRWREEKRKNGTFS